MKGLSPLIEAILLISIAVTLVAVASPWLMHLAQQATNNTGGTVDREVYCRDMSYDFVTDYGTYGVDWDFSGTDYLRVKIKNYGTVNIYDLSFQLELSDYSVLRFQATQNSQRSSANPLRPGESAIIEANMTQDITANLEKVTVLNGPGCDPLSMDV